MNCHITKLSKYVNHYIQPFAKELKSFIKDMIDFPNKINDLKTIPKDAILVTIDVRSVYSNIKHNKGFLTLEEHRKENPLPQK